ncbi:MAG: hypothetical protein GX591_13755 [Planctomycetes bacterium]|nr:hypothetical protein [Planctomycetota bacterium]
MPCVCLALGALALAAASAAWLPMWFIGDDAFWLAWADQAASPLAPRAGAIGDEPVTVAAAWWIAWRTLHMRYKLYQLAHVLAWTGVLAVYWAMLRQLWGRRRRPALIATALVAVAFLSFTEATLHLSRLALTLELLLGFGSVALAAAGWRTQRAWLVVLSAVPLAAACQGRPPAAGYLTILHVAAASLAWRHRAWRRGIVAAAAALTAVALASAMLGRVHLWQGIEPGGATRWLEARTAMVTGPMGLVLMLLAAGAGIVQGMRMQWRSWAAIGGFGALMALLTGGVHPLAGVLLIALPVPQARPFAAWGVLRQAVVLWGPVPWPWMPMSGALVYVPAFVIAIWSSPLAVWVERITRRLDPTGRRLIYFVVALGGILVAAHANQWLGRELAALRTLSAFRQVQRAVYDAAVRTVPPEGLLALASDLPGAAIPAPPAERPVWPRLGWRERFFAADQYAALLTLGGRGDIRMADPAAVAHLGGRLVIVGAAQRNAAEAALGDLGAAETFVSIAGQTGGLWYLPPGTASTAPATQSATER